MATNTKKKNIKAKPTTIKEEKVIEPKTVTKVEEEKVVEEIPTQEEVVVEKKEEITTTLLEDAKTEETEENKKAKNPYITKIDRMYNFGYMWNGCIFD